jgi:hypothetical protein
MALKIFRIEVGDWKCGCGWWFNNLYAIGKAKTDLTIDTSVCTGCLLEILAENYQIITTRPQVLVFEVSKFEREIYISDGSVASCHFSGDHIGDYILWDYYSDKLKTPTQDYASMWNTLAEGKMYHNEYPLDVAFDRQIGDAIRWLGYDTTKVLVTVLKEEDPDERLKIVTDLVFGRKEIQILPATSL